MKDKNFLKQKNNLSNAKNANSNYSQIFDLNDRRSISNNNLFISKYKKNYSSNNVKYGSYDKYFLMIIIIQIINI